ncbi:MAG TPA: ABC transporter permease subunit [Acidimicrobiales bacterium]|nr:ABC transporter permease subunit [Acidimicrobiales bacterium]
MTAVVGTPVSFEAPSTAGRAGLRRAMAAEWTKLWSVRSTTWTLVATVVAVVGLCAISTGTVSATDIIDDPTRRSLIGIFLGQLIFGVLGVLVMSAEYGTGTIRATLSAVPRRPVVLTAKVLVFGAVAVVVSEVLAFSAFAVGQAILSAKHAVGSSAFAAQHAQQLGVKVPHNVQGLLSTGSASLGQAGVLRAVVGAGLYLAVLGLLALGLATIIRHTAGAISAFVGVVLVLPLIVQALPTSISDAVARYLPANIGLVMFSTNGLPDRLGPAFSPWTGFAILVLYTVVILAIGCWVLVRRDA